MACPVRKECRRQYRNVAKCNSYLHQFLFNFLACWCCCVWSRIMFSITLNQFFISYIPVQLPAIGIWVCCSSRLSLLLTETNDKKWCPLTSVSFPLVCATCQFYDACLSPCIMVLNLGCLLATATVWLALAACENSCVAKHHYDSFILRTCCWNGCETHKNGSGCLKKHVESLTLRMAAWALLLVRMVQPMGKICSSSSPLDQAVKQANNECALCDRLIRAPKTILLAVHAMQTLCVAS